MIKLCNVLTLWKCSANRTATFQNGLTIKQFTYTITAKRLKDINKGLTDWIGMKWHHYLFLSQHVENWSHNKMNTQAYGTCCTNFLTHTHLHTVLLTELPAINDGHTRHGVIWAADRSHTCTVMHRALRVFGKDTAAPTQLLVELLLEGLAQKIEGKGVQAGVGEGQDTSYNAAHEMNQWGVHLAGKTERWHLRY